MDLLKTLDIAIGLALTYLILSLFASAIQEAIASLLRLRARFLVKGIRQLVGTIPSRTGGDLVGGILQHGLIQGTYQPLGRVRRIFASEGPSYVESRTFALALIDVLPTQYGDNPMLGISAKVAALPNGPLREALNALVADANGDANVVVDRIASWFDSAMDRVSGWYKRRTQMMLFALGLVIAGGFNIDSVELSKHLSVNKESRGAMAAYAEKWLKANDALIEKAVEENLATEQPTDDGPSDVSIQAAVTKLDSELKQLPLPIGYPVPMHWNLMHAIFGWLITAMAISLGAPFWVQSLRGLIAIKGVAKHDEQTDEARAGGKGSEYRVMQQPRSDPQSFEVTLTPDEVRDLQSVLGLLGVQKSGVLDFRTREAILAWQLKNRVKSNGVLTADLYANIMAVDGRRVATR